MRTREYNALILNRAKREWNSAMRQWEKANRNCAQAVHDLERKFSRLGTTALALELSYKKLKTLRSRMTNKRFSKKGRMFQRNVP